MLSELRTDETLLERIRNAATQPASADELQAQRVSFIMASLSENTTVTRTQVIEKLAALDGTDRK